MNLWHIRSHASRLIGAGGAGLAVAALALGLGLGTLLPAKTSVRGSEAGQDTDGLAPLPDRVSALEAFAPPVGTVMAYAGPWPPRQSGGRIATENNIGWLLCDDRTFAVLVKKHGISSKDLGGLKAALGSDRLPDLRGVFLRGVDASFDGKKTSTRDKEGIRSVGKEQGYATARPRKAFITGEEDKAHTHPYQDAYWAEVSSPEGNQHLLGAKGPFADDDNGRLYTNRDTSPNTQKHKHTVTDGGRPRDQACKYGRVLDHQVSVTLRWPAGLRRRPKDRPRT